MKTQIENELFLRVRATFLKKAIYLSSVTKGGLYKLPFWNVLPAEREILM